MKKDSNKKPDPKLLAELFASIFEKTPKPYTTTVPSHLVPIVVELEQELAFSVGSRAAITPIKGSYSRIAGLVGIQQRLEGVYVAANIAPDEEAAKKMVTSYTVALQQEFDKFGPSKGSRGR